MFILEAQLAQCKDPSEVYKAHSKFMEGEKRNLEERVRHLIAEERQLHGLISIKAAKLRDEAIERLSGKASCNGSTTTTSRICASAPYRNSTMDMEKSYVQNWLNADVDPAIRSTTPAINIVPCDTKAVLDDKALRSEKSIGDTASTSPVFEYTTTMASTIKKVERGQQPSDYLRSSDDPPRNAAVNFSPQGQSATVRFEEDDEDEIAGGLFSLDEDQPNFFTTKLPKRYNNECESDAEDDSYDSQLENATFTSPVREPKDGHTGALAYGTSLPVTIPAGRFWPPVDAVDSLKEKEGLLGSGDENAECRVKTVLPQRVRKDLYWEMRAQARSIQAADDPERLFGERPQRRRYQTGEPTVIPRPIPHHENAVVIVASSVASRI